MIRFDTSGATDAIIYSGCEKRFVTGARMDWDAARDYNIVEDWVPISLGGRAIPPADYCEEYEERAQSMPRAVACIGQSCTRAHVPARFLFGLVIHMSRSDWCASALDESFGALSLRDRSDEMSVDGARGDGDSAQLFARPAMGAVNRARRINTLATVIRVIEFLNESEHADDYERGIRDIICVQDSRRKIIIVDMEYSE